MTSSRAAEGLDADSLQFAAKQLARHDRHLSDVLRRLGPPPLWRRPANFATFARIILEQQVSLVSAKQTYDRLSAHLDGRVTAAKIRRADVDQLRKLGITRQKSRYIYQLSCDVSDGRFRIAALRSLDDNQVRQKITSRLGLGDWSADVFLLLALRRPDVLPIGDLALVKGLRELDGASYETRQSVLRRAQTWRPYRSVATRMIWQNYLDRRGQSVP